MHRLTAILAGILVLAHLGAMPLADELTPSELQVQIVQRGTLKFVTDKLVESPDSPGSMQKAGLFIDMLEETNRIPAKRGVNFGFRYQFNTSADVESVSLGVKLLTPPLYDPLSRRTTTEINFSQIARVDHVNTIAYGFDYDWELVPGTWVFQIHYQDHVLVEQEFEIYDPDDV